MSEVTEVAHRKYHFNWQRRGLTSWFESREELGQEKYGKGRKNAGYRRDNLLDVLEEVTDAITIMDFFLERLGKTADATSRWQLKVVNKAIELNNALLDMAEQVDTLRESIDDEFHTLLREDTKRAVPLEPQSFKREA